MKSGTREPPRIAAAIAGAVDYEVAVAELARRSERRAWSVAGVSVLLVVTLLGGYFYVLPLKEKAPYLVMADANSGQATLARLRAGSKAVTASEAVNRANVATFIRARESYDWDLIGARDWKVVFTMAEPQVTSTYRALYSPRNASGPLAMYGKAHSLRIRILSIQLFGSDPSKGASGATVRFQRSVLDKASGMSRFLDNKIASVEYTYKPELEMDEQDRLLNPLGFRVTGYRVDNDYATTPAVDDEAMSSPAGPPQATPSATGAARSSAASGDVP